MKCMWVTTICLVGLLIGDVRAQPTSDGPSLRFGILRQQCGYHQDQSRCYIFQRQYNHSLRLPSHRCFYTGSVMPYPVQEACPDACPRIPAPQSAIPGWASSLFALEISTCYRSRIAFQCLGRTLCNDPASVCPGTRAEFNDLVTG